jgi:hypothetical protein
VLFGKAPRSYAYDRGDYSQENIERLRELGVRDVGLAPRGQAKWQVEGRSGIDSSRTERWSRVPSAPSSASSTAQSSRSPFGREDGRMRSARRARPEPNQAHLGRRWKKRDCSVQVAGGRAGSSPTGQRSSGERGGRNLAAVPTGQRGGDFAPEFPDKPQIRLDGRRLRRAGPRAGR